MANKNRINSPLLEYIKKYLRYPGKKSLGNQKLQDALDLVNKKLSDCCKYINPKTNDIFLSNVSFLLNDMSIKHHKMKLLEIKEYLELQLTPECC
jgi:hypothetical protein